MHLMSNTKDFTCGQLAWENRWHFETPPMVSPQNNIWETGLKIVTAIVANATNSFSLATKNSGLVAMLATRFRYDLYWN